MTRTHHRFGGLLIVIGAVAVVLSGDLDGLAGFVGTTLGLWAYGLGFYQLGTLLSIVNPAEKGGKK
jgi:hypothetical protein